MSDSFGKLTLMPLKAPRSAAPELKTVHIPTVSDLRVKFVHQRDNSKRLTRVNMNDDKV